jgi:molybdate transport system substrate-binding protein
VRTLVAAVAAAAVVAVVATACGSSSSSTTGAGTTSSTKPPDMTGHLDVFAAASLTTPFDKAKAVLEKSDPGLSLTYNFAGTNALVAQIQQGAPADVMASADTKNMQSLVHAGLVDSPVVFARNKLEIAVAPGNPKHINGLADLARPDVAVVLEAPGVPAGDYARQALAAQGIKVEPKSLETDVKSALAKVTSGEADATVVYVTDVAAAGPKVTGVAIPDEENVVATYPIAVVRATANPSAAQAFVDSAVSGEVQQELEAAGFLSPK